MKKVRLMISAAIVFAVVGSALAFKPVQQGTIYCEKSGTTCLSKIDFEIDPDNLQTSVSDPCLNGAGKEYIQTSTDCVEQLNKKFKTTDF